MKSIGFLIILWIAVFSMTSCQTTGHKQARKGWKKVSWWPAAKKQAKVTKKTEKKAVRLLASKKTPEWPAYDKAWQVLEPADQAFDQAWLALRETQAGQAYYQAWQAFQKAH